MEQFPLTPLEKLPMAIDHSAIEAAYLPYLVSGREGDRAWKSDYVRRRRRALLRLIRRVLGLSRRGREASRRSDHELPASGGAPSAWRWGNRRLALDAMAAVRLRIPLLAAVVADLKPARVLEVGCGKGVHLFSLARNFPEVEFTGIDIDEARIDSAKAEQARDPDAYKRISFVHGDAAKMPFDSESFDVVLSVLAVEKMAPIRDDVLAEIARVSNQHVLMLEPFRDANRSGLRRLYAVSRSYFRGSIGGLRKIGLEPVWATDDFPQEAFLGSPLVLARKVRTPKL
jgi:SAM-dependent methyltransferase